MFTSFLIIGLTLIFISIILTVFYHLFRTYSHNMFQQVYSVNDPRYSKGVRPGCLPGCTAEGECPQGNFCYDALGDNPSCCAYDFQCEGCKSRMNIRAPLQKKDGYPPLSLRLGEYETKRNLGRDFIPDGPRRATNQIWAHEPPDIDQVEFQRDLDEQKFAKEERPGEKRLMRKGHIIGSGPLRPNIIRR